MPAQSAQNTGPGGVSTSQSSLAPAKPTVKLLPRIAASTIHSKRNLAVIIVVLLLIGTAAATWLFKFGYLSFEGTNLKIGKNAVEVSGNVITRDQFKDRLDDQKYFYSNITKLTDEEFAKLDEKVREEMIMEVLLTKFLAENGITVTDEEISNRLKARVVDPQFAGDWGKYSAELETRYKTTLDQVKRTERIEVLKEKLVQLQTTKHFLAIWIAKTQPQFVTRDLMPPEGVLKMDSANAAKKEKAEVVLKRIQSGECFTKVAGEVTEDQVTRERMGDLGFIYLPKTTQSQAQPNLESFAGMSAILSDFEKIGKNETKLVETFTGYAILSVAEVKEGPLQNMSFEEWYSAYREEAGVRVL